MSLSVLGQRDALGVKEIKLFIDGAWTEGAGAATWTHVHPSTNEEVLDIPVASAADVDAAVRAARRAFDEGPWPTMNAKDRKAILTRIVALVREHEDELNRLQILDNGLPMSFMGMYAVNADVVADVFEYYAGWSDKIAGETLPTFTGSPAFVSTLREPVGVVAAVIAWNAPMTLFAQKVAPALAAGCTIVVKPSEYASIAVARLVGLIEEAGLPAGVLNLVMGPADPTGEALITHPGVDKITFTGSRAVGTRLMQAAAVDIKRISLELGGKSPNLVFDDVSSLDMAALTAFGMVSFGISGQGCVCQTRALVQRSIYDEFIEKAAGMAAMIQYGDPYDPATTSAPIINKRQLGKVEGYINSAQEQGARLVVGGGRPDGDLASGNFVNPTLFADVTNEMTIAREEIFGPVLSVIPFDTEEEGIRLANDTPYGLGAGIQTSDIARAFRVGRRLRAGTVGVNVFGYLPNVPFGGYKVSGLGRENGSAGLDPYLETKTLIIDTPAG